MTLDVMLVVLLGALLHASWNAMIRGATDRTLDTVLIVAGAGAITALGLPLLPLPAPASWPCLLASGAIHVAYFLLVAGAYRHGELSLVYPLMRGTAPAVSALAAALLLAEVPSAGGGLGVLLIGGGVVLLAGQGWHARTMTAHAVSYALATAAVIVVYTLVDGIGVRLSGHAAAYTGWMFLLTALPLLGLFLVRQPTETAGYLRRHWRRGLAGGACTLASYGLALWAMTRAPIALVAALRETSVVFATLIAVFILRERITPLRLASIAAVTAGATAIKLA